MGKVELATKAFRWIWKFLDPKCIKNKDARKQDDELVVKARCQGLCVPPDIFYLFLSSLLAIDEMVQGLEGGKVGTIGKAKMLRFVVGKANLDKGFSCSDIPQMNFNTRDSAVPISRGDCVDGFT
uniref:Uncharacterized protein n=1 Tax=Romanomermis culicivorax TaxID=13658 RepID=A0A915K3Y8_ROMCU